MTENPRNVMVCDAPYLQNEFGDPNFFYFFNPILSFSTSSESFEKICALELLGVNVLKQCPVVFPPKVCFVFKMLCNFMQENCAEHAYYCSHIIKRHNHNNFFCFSGQNNSNY